MAEGMSFSFPSLLFHEGRTYGQLRADLLCRIHQCATFYIFNLYTTSLT